MTCFRKIIHLNIGIKTVDIRGTKHVRNFLELNAKTLRLSLYKTQGRHYISISNVVHKTASNRNLLFICVFNLKLITTLSIL